MGRSTARLSAAGDETFDEAEPGSAEAPTEGEDDPDADDAWAESLRDVLRQVIASLPDHATLGELVDAARGNPAIAPVLDLFTVRELIETAKKKPKADAPKPSPRRSAKLDEDSLAATDLDAGPRVIRRRADVPDGDLRVLRALSTKGPMKESELVSATALTAEQLRIIVRHLRTKGFIHVEGSAIKRRLKLTRNGGVFLRNAARGA